MLLAVVSQDLHVLDGALERFLRAMEVEDAPAVAIVLQRIAGDRLMQDLLRVDAQAVLAQRVDARPLLRALAQEQQGPGPQPRIGRRPEAQRLILGEQRFQQDHRRLGRGPGERVAGRDHAGIAPARLQRRALPALHQDDLVAVLQELIRGRHADDAAAHHQDPHRSPLREALPDHRRFSGILSPVAANRSVGLLTAVQPHQIGRTPCRIEKKLKQMGIELPDFGPQTYYGANYGKMKPFHRIGKLVGPLRARP